MAIEKQTNKSKMPLIASSIEVVALTRVQKKSGSPKGLPAFSLS